MHYYISSCLVWFYLKIAENCFLCKVFSSHIFLLLLSHWFCHFQGMVLLSPSEKVVSCRSFEAEVYVLFHSKQMTEKFQTTVHIGTVCQTAVIHSIKDKVSFSIDCVLLLLSHAVHDCCIQHFWENIELYSSFSGDF